MLIKKTCRSENVAKYLKCTYKSNYIFICLEIINIFGPTEYMRKMVLKTSLCRPLVLSFPTILGIRSLDFSEIWHERSLMWFLKSDGARFSKNIYFCPQQPFKGVFLQFLAFLGICSLDFSNFWTFRIYEENGPMYQPSFVRQSVRQSVSQLPTFLGIRALDFSEIWHEGSLMVPLKTDGARFIKKSPG